MRNIISQLAKKFNINEKSQNQERSRFMQLKNAEHEQINARSGRFVKRIGSTVYEVSVRFDAAKEESLEEKMFRLMKSDLKNERLCGKIALPQAERLPERETV
jgi:hypothetical protein